MAENQETLHCLNCGKPLSADYQYCPFCAQKRTTGKQSIKDFVSEFLDALWSLDSRFFRTIRDVWFPAKITLAYFDGKHKTYMHPLRLFLLTAIVHFAVISYQTDEVVTAKLKEASTSYSQFNAQKEFQNDLRLLGDSLKISFPGENHIVDTLLAGGDSLIQRKRGLGDLVFWSVNNDEGEEVQIKTEELYTLSYDSLLNKYNIHGFFGKTAVHQQIKAAKNPDRFYRSLVANSLWMVLLMTIGLALTMKLLYLRRKRFLVEHLVFSLHLHAFAFLLISPFYLTVEWINPRWFFAVFAIILLFWFFAQKRYYGQTTGKTLMKWLFLLWSYFFIALGCFLISLIINFLLF